MQKRLLTLALGLCLAALLLPVGARAAGATEVTIVKEDTTYTLNSSTPYIANDAAATTAATAA